MLVLSRKEGERILISGGIAVTILRCERGRVQVGIEAPQSITIKREELAFSPLDLAEDDIRVRH